MWFDVLLKLSLGILLLGTALHVRRWFRIRIGPDAAALSPWRRAAAALRGMLPVLFGRRVFSLLRALLFDVLLQTRTLRRDVWRWVAHMLISYGFLLLLLLHGLGRAVTASLFPGHEPTLNPFLWLRNLLGVMVLLGVSLAAFRRLRLGKPALFTRRSDRVALYGLAAILIGGFFLEAAKIVSEPLFREMVDAYAPMADEDEVGALETYWAARFGVVFADTGTRPVNPEAPAPGARVHERSCASCHDRPVAAWVSFPLSRLLAPAAPFLNRVRADRWLYHLHVLSCLLVLALAPFTKFFHLAAAPAALLSRAALNPATVLPGNLATRRALALDACTHCGDCTLHCSVAPVYRRIRNPDILPSEKLFSIRQMALGGASFSPSRMRSLAEGASLCTLCYRCTTLCPSGITLQDLWTAASADLARSGFPEPHVRVKEACTSEWAERIQYHTDAFPYHRSPLRPDRGLSDRSETFEACIQCQTCTNVCPVVAWSPDPAGDVGITPQQIMNLLRIGLKEMTLGSPMVWDCATCYMCQEHCPEGIRVTDILYELRNLAYEKFRALPDEEPPGAGRPASARGRPASARGAV